MRIYINATALTTATTPEFWYDAAEDRRVGDEVLSIAAFAGFPKTGTNETDNTKLELPSLKLQKDTDANGSPDTNLDVGKTWRKNGIHEGHTVYLVDA